MGPGKLFWLALAAAPAPVLAQATADAGSTVSTVVVTADKAGLLERRAGNVVLGLDKPLGQTPRAATVVSDTILQRYGAQTVDDLVALSPGAFTASYYGVAGALNLRGTLAETYFRGFKLVEDRGTYTTPIDDAAEVDIVRGPPSPIYGAGKVGGFLNIVPKTAEDERPGLDRPTGEISAEVGSYQLKDFTAQGATPVRVGALDGGVYAYGDYYDAHSYYHGIYPSRQTAELAGTLDLTHGWRLEGGALYLHEDGDIQTPGWNRLTQDLIDNGTYLTGRNTTLVDTNHDGRLEPGEVGPGPASSYPYGTTILQFVGGGAKPVADPRFVLDTGVGTTQLSPKTVFVSDADFSHTDTHVYYADLDKQVSSDSDVKFQLFFNDLDNKRFVSYGFPAWYRTYVTEARVPYRVKLSAPGGWLSADTVVGVDYRYTQAHRQESFDSGLIAVDRRDLAFGPTATDIFDSPFQNSPGGIGWETDIRSRERDAGGFATTDIAVAHRLDLVLGGRYDAFNVESRDNGVYSFTPPNQGTLRAGHGKGTYSASLTYKLPLGLIPYATYASDAALELNQASDIPTSAIASGGWLSQVQPARGGDQVQRAARGAGGGGGRLSPDPHPVRRLQLRGPGHGRQGHGGGAALGDHPQPQLHLRRRHPAHEVKGPDDSEVLIPPSDRSACRTWTAMAAPTSR